MRGQVTKGAIALRATGHASVTSTGNFLHFFYCSTIPLLYRSSRIRQLDSAQNDFFDAYDPISINPLLTNT
jgi:hypothetical protein